MGCQQRSKAAALLILQVPVKPAVLLLHPDEAVSEGRESKTHRLLELALWSAPAAGCVLLLGRTRWLLAHLGSTARPCPCPGETGGDWELAGARSTHWGPREGSRGALGTKRRLGLRPASPKCSSGLRRHRRQGGGGPAGLLNICMP